MSTPPAPAHVPTPRHSPLPWRAAPTGQLFDANGKPIIGVGAFNSRWDGALTRDAVNSRKELVGALQIVDQLLKGEMNYEHAVVDIHPDDPDCNTPAKYVRRALSRARAATE